MKLGTLWVLLSTFFSPVLLLAIILTLGTGCAGNAGMTKVRAPVQFEHQHEGESENTGVAGVAEQTCWGISWVFGDANNGCGLRTGGISIPGLDFVLGLMDAAKGLGLGLIGQSEQPAPVFNFSGIEPVQPESD